MPNLPSLVKSSADSVRHSREDLTSNPVGQPVTSSTCLIPALQRGHRPWPLASQRSSMIGPCSTQSRLVSPSAIQLGSSSYTHPGWSDLGIKWVRLAPNGTNPGIFSDQIQFILAPRAKMYWIWSEKIRRFVPFEDNLTHFGANRTNFWPTSNTLM